MSDSENKVAYILQIWFLINELDCCFLHILIFNKGDLCYPTRKSNNDVDLQTAI